MTYSIKILEKALLDRMQEIAGPEVNGFKPLIDFNAPDTDLFVIGLKRDIKILRNIAEEAAINYKNSQT